MVQPAIKIAVIPAWMPESSHRDVNLRMTQAVVQAACYLHGTGYRRPCRYDEVLGTG